jgi:hypothetical protein
VNVRAQNHVAAPAAVPTVGSAFWDELFPAKTNAAAAASAGLGKNFDAIDEHEER